VTPRRGLAVAAGIAGLAAGAGLAYARWEAGWYALRRVRVALRGGPDGSAVAGGSLRVLHISDLHMTGRDQARAAWVRGLSAARPDLVVLTGDNFAQADGLGPLLGALDPLLAVPGAFVFGSNDYYSSQWHNPLRYLLTHRDARERVAERTPDLPCEELRTALTLAGWADLNNARTRLWLKGGALPVDLVGLDDPHIGRDALPESGPVAQGGDGQGADGADVVRIGIVHGPYERALRALTDDGAELILSGHTHGGQLAVPGWGALVSNCDLTPRKARGLHGWPGARPDSPGGLGSVWLHVSAGLGTSPYAPFRFACRPEATLLEVVWG
jgi:predicted MPP superfamily phosphohydrolase